MIIAGALLLTALLATPQDVAEGVAQLKLRGELTFAEEHICAARPLVTFYERRGMAPAWNEANLNDLTVALDAAAIDGLDPADYHHAALHRVSGLPREMLATDAFLLLVTDLTRGRINPQTMLPERCLPPRNVDAAALLEQALYNGRIRAAIESAAPQHEQYQRMRDALARIRAAKDWQPVASKKALKRGGSGPAVNALRLRLGLPPEGSYDAPVEERVRAEQRQYGLDEDGVAGPQTIAVLNVPRARRIEQLLVNLERWRWMPATLGDSYVVVNIAGFSLDLIDGDESKLSMRTVVGKPFTKTPFFASAIERVIVNPSWRVPDSIAYKELYPKQRRSPGFFAREHIVVEAGGRLRQLPGEWNSLGRIKFDLPNSHGVYLHDTPARSLFASSSRAFSHGCIRLEKPLDLAEELLRGVADRADIEARIASGREQAIPLPRKMPVYILYWTVAVRDDGTVVFLRDVYARDDVLLRAMRTAR